MARFSPLLAALWAAFCGAALAGTPVDSLYARLGGEAGVSAIVSDTVDAAAARPVLQAAFARDELKQQLAARICSLAGGGCRASDSLGLGDREFAEFVEVLRVALRQHAVPLATRNELLETLAPLRHDLASR
jgi:hemoglobin